MTSGIHEYEESRLPVLMSKKKCIQVQVREPAKSVSLTHLLEQEHGVMQVRSAPTAAIRGHPLPHPHVRNCVLHITLPSISGLSFGV